MNEIVSEGLKTVVDQRMHVAAASLFLSLSLSLALALPLCLRKNIQRAVNSDKF